MSDAWTELAKSHGRRSVMSLSISEEQLEAETARQLPILCGMIHGQLHGHERTGLDFGCGSGRFSHALAQTIHGRVTAFDSCAALVALATWQLDVDYVSSDSAAFFDELIKNDVTYDVVMAAQVLGSPGLPLESTAASLTEVLAPGGLLIIVDHMPEIIPTDRWWRFRPRAFYGDLFRRNGVELAHVGDLAQLENTISMLGGRKV